MVGVSDLIVIDALGNIQVIDYKTSPKTYNNYNAYKKKTFYYQLATYRRMIERHLSLDEKSRTFVIPIQFKDFRYEPETGLQFSEIRSTAMDEDGNVTSSYLEEINILIGDESEGIVANLNTFLPIDPIVDDTPEEILEKNKSFMQECFTSYSDSFELTLDKVKEKIKKQHGGKIKKDKLDKYKYELGKEVIIADSEVELIEKVFNKLKDLKDLKSTNTQGLKGILRTGNLSKLGKMKRIR
jgi:signal recognition particle GTPase